MKIETFNADLQRTIRLLPGYDPFAQAGDRYEFCEDSAAYAIEFIETCCTFVEGPKGGQPFVLEPWQAAIFANLWGWREISTGHRRYREALVFIPRGNGKTEIAALVVCLFMFLDHERGARLYSSAAEADQARLCFDRVAGMIRNEPLMRDRAEIFKYTITAGDKSYKYLSAAAGTKHGFNVQLVVNDELHAHKTAELTEVLMTGMGKRPNPFCIHLTTSDYEREGSICNEKHDYAGKVRDGIIDDPAFLPVIYEASREDDWTSPDVWAKANPNLGVSVPVDYIERECKRAKSDPLYENTFKRLHLNIRTEQAERLLPIEKWDGCAVESLPDLAGCRCWCGLDIGSTGDFTAFCAVFPEGDSFYAMPIFWIPESASDRRRERLGPQYLAWERAGVLRITPGDEVDYARVEADIVEFAEQYAVQEIAADRLFQGAQLVQNLGERHGFAVVAHGMGYLSMAAPTKAFLERVGNRTLVHDGNPVLRWMVSNLMGKQDEAGNFKPDKKHSGDKIDGVVALIMGLGRAEMLGLTGSAYEDHGVFYASEV